MAKYALGVDYGTNSVRALIVDVSNGDEIGTAVWNYETGTHGVHEDDRDVHLARQNPADYQKGFFEAVKGAVADAQSTAGFETAQIIGIGGDQD